MTDPIKVRFPCDHNHWFKHFIKGSYVWCDGGTTRRLRPTTLKDHTVKPDDVLYVEVDGDE